MSPSLFLLPFLLLTSLLPPSTSTTPSQCNIPNDSANTLQIIHAFSPCSPLRSTSPTPTSSFEDFILTQLSSDQIRLSYLSSLALAKHSWVPLASGTKLLQTPTYVVRARIGTPPQPMLVALDTSSDAAWIPSSACKGCPASTNAYSPKRSTTFKSVPCQSAQCNLMLPNACPPSFGTCFFNFTYGSSSLFAQMADDSLALASDVVKGFTFGSVVEATGSSVLPQGLLGLGRGRLSFLSQTHDLYASTFSYCLPSFRSLNFSGTLRLGPSGQPVRIKTTPLLSNPRRSSLYYVNLLRIRVGRKWMAVPTFNPTTGAGTVFDSGTMFTRLVAPVYEAVRDEFRKRVNRPVTTLGGFDTCYHGAVVVPPMTFEFTGMNVTLPVENVMIHSLSTDVSCLAMASAPDNVNSVLNVIANMQQQNHRILFDVPKGRIGVSRETCTAA